MSDPDPHELTLGGKPPVEFIKDAYGLMPGQRPRFDLDDPTQSALRRIKDWVTMAEHDALTEERPVAHLSKADTHTGAMVALYPPPDVAGQLAQPGGEPAESLHVTLAYLGPAANIEEPDMLKRAVAEFAARTAPLVGSISGVGHFTSGPVPVTYASVDVPTLPAARERLVFDLTSWAQAPSREHGLSPHLTLSYDDRQGVILPADREIRFDAVTLMLAGERTDFPLYGTHAEWVVPLWKADDGAGDDPMIVYGVVLQPGIRDSQGDIVSAAEIEKAAHRYMLESRMVDLQHNDLQEPGAGVVESFIAHTDLVVAGRPVVKGAWVMATAITDPIRKADIREGRLTGYSIGGSAVRI